MGSLTIQQQKERLKRELARVEQKEKHLKKQSLNKNLKAINAEILKYDIEGIDNLKKIIGLLGYFDFQDEDFKNGILRFADRELEERKAKKVARTFKKKD